MAEVFALRSVVSTKLSNCRCWDDTDKEGIWWIIKGPITASLLVSSGTFSIPVKFVINHILFLGGNKSCKLFIKTEKCFFFTGQHSHLHQRDQDSGPEAEILSHGWKQRDGTFHVRERFTIQLLGDTVELSCVLDLILFVCIGKQMLT